MPRHVLVINHYAVPRTAAGGTRHVEMFGRLARWQPTIVCASRILLDGSSTGRDDPLFETVLVTPYRTNGLMRIANWASFTLTACVRCLGLPRPDVVVASSPHLLAPVAGLLVARVRRVPFVLEIRDIWPQVLVEMGALSSGSLIFRFLCRLEAFLYDRSDRVIVLAPGTARHVERCGVDPRHIAYLPNAADPADFTVTERRDALRQRLGLPGDRTIVVYTGAHGPANGLHLVLDAAITLKAELPEVQLLLVGGGVEKRRLLCQAHARGLDNVVFWDPIPKTQIPELLAAVDVGLHCLTAADLFDEGISPNKLYDYMAAGLPVVTNTPGVAGDLVEAAGAGLAVAPDSLADGIASMCRMSEDRRRELGAAGRRYVQEQHSRALMVERLESLLEELVEEGPTSWR